MIGIIIITIQIQDTKMFQLAHALDDHDLVAVEVQHFQFAEVLQVVDLL